MIGLVAQKNRALAMPSRLDFDYVPGLRVYSDSTFNKSEDGTVLQNIPERSLFSPFTQANVGNRPDVGTFQGKKSTVFSSSDYVEASRGASGFRFLSNGAPHGIFTIFGYPSDTFDGTNQQYYLYTSVSGTSNFLVFSATKKVRRVANPMGLNITSTDSINIGSKACYVQSICYGAGVAGNDYEVYLNGALDGAAATVTASAGETTDTLRHSINTSAAFKGHHILTVIYDWTGYTQAQVSAFRVLLDKLIKARFKDFIL
jgi:hypothetical protein